MTYFLTKKMEDQKAIRAKEERENFNKYFKNKVSYDLGVCVDFLQTLNRMSMPIYDRTTDRQTGRRIIIDRSHKIIGLVEHVPEEPKDVPIERKMGALGGTTFSVVESAYRTFSEFVTNLKLTFKDEPIGNN